MAYKPILRDDPAIVLFSDASKSGWGGLNDNDGSQIQGKWDTQQIQEHINYLELLAACNTIQGLLPHTKSMHVRIYMDNSVAVSYINNMGGRILSLHTLTKRLLFWCKDRHIWLSAAHVPGRENITADRLSRDKNDDKEWMLKPRLFDKLEAKLGFFDVDFFASAINYQIKPYVSYNPDPEAMAVDAFTVKWNGKFCYLFPPFSLLNRSLQKMVVEEVQTLVLIAPIWPTQVWFPQILHHVCQQSYILPSNCIQHPRNTEKQHQVKKLRLAAFVLSGNRCRIEDYQMSLSTSSANLGESRLVSNMGHISKDGCVFRVKNKFLHLTHL